MSRKTVKELEEELRTEKERADYFEQLYNDLVRKVEEESRRYTEIPVERKRGRQRQIDPETRQYVHELAKIKDGSGKPVNSLSSIASICGISKTQTHSILKEQEIPGRWFSLGDDGIRVYYKNYLEAVASKKVVHFEAKKVSQEESDC